MSPLPAFIYFALNGKDTLNLDPYNQPIQALANKNIRCYSWDLPFHLENKDPSYSLKQWNESFEKGIDFITPFLDEMEENIEKLIASHAIKKNAICLAGLSRGGFMAFHLAKRLPYVKHVLAYAPLTNLHSFQGEANFSQSIFDQWNVIESTEDLLHKKIRIYIGNLDERVGTDHSYDLIRTLTKTAHTQRMRHYDYELIISPSIGHKGHGTSQEVFFQGAEWAANMLEAV